MNRLYLILLAMCFSVATFAQTVVPVSTTLVINEIDYDQPGTDTTEFVEILNVSSDPINLSNYIFFATNGNTMTDYIDISLPDVDLNPGEYFVICFGNNSSPYCDLTVSTGLQNGPDGIGLNLGGVTGGIIDYVSYEGITTSLFAKGNPVDPGDNNDDVGIGLARIPNGNDTGDNASDFILAPITPGLANSATDSASVQIIHNSPMPTVDIYAGDDLLVDNFEFRDATAFRNLPSGVEINIGVALDNSTSSADAIETFPITLDSAGTYVVVATGIVGNETTPFTLAIFDQARTSSSSESTVELLAYHGSTDAPVVDVFLPAASFSLVDDIAYGEFSDDYAAVLPSSYDLSVTPADDNQTTVASYRADVSGLAGSALTVFASGFLTGDAPDFGLWVADAAGNTFPLEQIFLDSAQVQIYHNVADTPVDIYLNGEILLDDFQYQDATQFVNVAAVQTNTIAVAPATSTSAEEAIETFELVLEADRAYTVIANGEIGSDSNPFGLVINDIAKTAADDPATVEVNVFHGSATSPAVDVAAVGVGNLFENLSYTDFSAYGAVPPATYTLQVKPTGTEDVVASFDADLSGLAGGAATVIAFGELGNDENPFSLNAVLADGTVLPIMNTPLANVQLIHNAIAPTVDVYANGELLVDNFEFRTAEPFQMLPAGVDIEIAIAADTSTSAASAIFTTTVQFVDGQEYVVVAGGALGSDDFPFGLFV
ncbi:MAG: DUF4397 domain-containing protein, partial [Bacteroidota bacterium]